MLQNFFYLIEPISKPISDQKNSDTAYGKIYEGDPNSIEEAKKLCSAEKSCGGIVGYKQVSRSRGGIGSNIIYRLHRGHTLYRDNGKDINHQTLQIGQIATTGIRRAMFKENWQSCE